MEKFSVLCHFFLICYDPKLTRIPEGIPDTCEGYFAPPPPPFTSEEMYYISVKCPQSTDLKMIFRKFNTLQFSNPSRHDFFEENSFNGMSVASLVFDNIRFSVDTSVKMFNGIIDLKAITFVGCDFSNLESYEMLRVLKELEYIYMKSVTMARIFEGFDDVSFMNVKVALFDSVKDPDKDGLTVPIGVFNKWENLRMLTIVNSRMNDVNWLAGDFFNLRRLDLSKNSIELIPENLIQPRNFPKLKYLNLNGNDIRFISENVLPNRADGMWDQFNELYMNRLCCNNKLAWIKPYVEEHSIPSSFYLLCHIPANVVSPLEFIQGVSAMHFESSNDCTYTM